jgi:allantoicase
MGDGWETKRSRREGPDWVVVRLAAPGIIQRALVDTLHFKGNFPESCALHVTHVKEGAAAVDVTTLPESAWTELLPRTKLQAHTLHTYEDELRAAGAATHVRMRIWPDGGISRLRLFGQVTAAGKAAQGLRFLNAVPAATRERLLRGTCGSTAFAKALASRAPFASFGDLEKAASEVFSTLTPTDLSEAFSAHPRIGEKRADAQAMGEQAKVAAADQATLDALAAANAAYEEKFGRIYIVCATGKSATEMLEIARARMANDAPKELAVAAEEQRKIMQIRLAKLVHRT